MTEAAVMNQQRIKGGGTFGLFRTVRAGFCAWRPLTN